MHLLSAARSPFPAFTRWRSRPCSSWASPLVAARPARRLRRCPRAAPSPFPRTRLQACTGRTRLDFDDRQPFFKSGGTLELGHGRYVFHNTMLQARQSGLAYGLGGGFGLGGTGSAQLIENTWSRNNIYHQWKEGKGFAYQCPRPQSGDPGTFQ